VRRLAEHLVAVAEGATARTSDEDIVTRLTQAERLCEQVAAEDASTALQALVSNVRTALQTWQAVWPRLGGQREFRQAVAREAGLWSRRLTALAKQA